MYLESGNNINNHNPSVTWLSRNGALDIKNKGVIIFMENKSVTIGANSNIIDSPIITGDSNAVTLTWGEKEKENLHSFIEQINNSPVISDEDKQDTIEIINDITNKKNKGILRFSFLDKMWLALPEAVKVTKEAVNIFNMFKDSGQS